MATTGVFRAAVASGVVACGAVLASAPAHAAVEREIYLENACKHPIRVIVSHAPTEDSWDPHGWYEFEANSEAVKLLDGNDDPLLQLDDHALFVFGEATDGAEAYWEGEDDYETFSEVSYGMKRATVQVVSGHFQIRLACDDID